MGEIISRFVLCNVWRKWMILRIYMERIKCFGFCFCNWNVCWENFKIPSFNLLCFSPGERPCKCHLCPKDYPESRSLRKHLLTHGIEEGEIIISGSRMSGYSSKGGNDLRSRQGGKTKGSTNKSKVSSDLAGNKLKRRRKKNNFPNRPAPS